MRVPIEPPKPAPAKPDRPTGQRFSLSYLERGAPSDDSKRMRRRIGALIFEYETLKEQLATAVRSELGIAVPYPTYWAEFMETALLHDVLDLVTVAYRLLRSRYLATAPHWLSGVQRIFEEENVHYRVDAEGGVHFYPDAAYTGNRAATIAAMQSNRYVNALDQFERGTAALTGASPDGKGAIRGVFSAAEALFKMIVPGQIRLGAAELDSLSPILQRHFADDDTAKRAVAKMLASLNDWVGAAHFYRHEEGTVDEVAQPPLPLAVYIVGTGASHVRWLAELDAALRQ